MNEPLEQELEQLLAHYRQLPRAEPSAALDAAVLAHARAQTRPARKRRVLRWAAPLASAAVLVLAVGIGWQMHEQAPTQLPMSPLPIDTGAARTVGELSLGEAKEERRQAEADANADRNSERLLTPEEMGGDAARVHSNTVAGQRSDTQATSARKRDEPAVLRPVEAPRPVPQAMTTAMKEQSPAPAAAPEAAAALAVPSASSEKALELLDSRDQIMQEAAPPAADTPPVPVLERESVLESAQGSTTRAQPADPQDWLLRIRRLRDRDEWVQAREQLQEFRRAYPQLEVPEDLRALLN